jgi:hypothetical protein
VLFIVIGFDDLHDHRAAPAQAIGLRSYFSREEGTLDRLTVYAQVIHDPPKHASKSFVAFESAAERARVHRG